MSYIIYSLLRNIDGNIKGPLGPITSMNEVAKELGFGYNGLARIDNDQSPSSYDHLLARAKYDSGEKLYFLIVDLGDKVLPIALIDSKEEIVITPIYKEEIKNMRYHRLNLEMRNSKQYSPIMILKEKDIKEIIDQAEKENAFDIISNR